MFGFDVQPRAIATARERLQLAGVASRVEWRCAGHESLAAQLPADWKGRVRAVMFNLGYLPGGGDKRRCTSVATTLAALEASLSWLAPGGVISVIGYVGHPGGREETEAVIQWAGGLPPKRFEHRVVIPEGRRDPPRLLLLTKQCRGSGLGRRSE